jgi:hypothetical protein
LRALQRRNKDSVAAARRDPAKLHRESSAAMLRRSGTPIIIGSGNRFFLGYLGTAASLADSAGGPAGGRDCGGGNTLRQKPRVRLHFD